MGVGESGEPNSGLWGKVELDDIPGPTPADVKQEPPLVTRKPTLMGFSVADLGAVADAAGTTAGAAPEAGRAEAGPRAPHLAGGLDVSARAGKGTGMAGTAERLGQMVENLSEGQKRIPISPGRTLIGGTFPAAAAAPPVQPLGQSNFKGTLLGVPAPVLEPAFSPTTTAVVGQGLYAGPNALRPTPERGTPQAGHLGRFRIVRKIGTGRAGAVFLAQRDDAGPGALPIAVKVLREQVYQESAALKALFREARLAALMDHRNVVRVIDIGYHKRQPYVVMDYVDGLSFAALLAHPVNVPLAVGLRCIVDALHGLDYAHKLTDANGAKLGLVHCDISPENILVGIDGNSRVTDFGVARTREEHGEEFVFRGRASYSAPELLGGEQTVTPQTDIYGVGAVLYRLATGISPFQGKSEEERITNALTHSARRLRELNPRLPEWLDQVCARALNRDPARRYTSCAEMAMALEREAGADGLIADPAAVGDWVSKVRKSLSGEEAFGATELADLAKVAIGSRRPEATATVVMQAPKIPGNSLPPPPEVEESSSLQFRVGVGAAAFLLVVAFAAWAWLSPSSFHEFMSPATSATQLAARPRLGDSSVSGVVQKPNLPLPVTDEGTALVIKKDTAAERPAPAVEPEKPKTVPPAISEPPKAAAALSPAVKVQAAPRVVPPPAVVRVAPQAPSPPKPIVGAPPQVQTAGPLHIGSAPSARPAIVVVPVIPPAPSSR